jgi:hypothetical protein
MSPRPSRSARFGAARSFRSSISATTSSIAHNLLSIPAAIAGEVRKVLMDTDEVVPERIEGDLEFLAERVGQPVNRRMLIRIVGFARSA